MSNEESKMKNSDWKKQEKLHKQSLKYLIEKDAGKLSEHLRDYQDEREFDINGLEIRESRERKITENKKIPNWFLDELRSRVSVSELWRYLYPIEWDNPQSRYFLKKQGGEYRTFSPFKKEDTPSFSISDRKGFFHCFSTGEHGDIFSLLMKISVIKKNFRESVIFIANNVANMRIPEKSESKEEYFYKMKRADISRRSPSPARCGRQPCDE